MGRKIPARKHRGIRDPLKQKINRSGLRKDINNPPDENKKISKKFTQFAMLINDSKKGKLKRVQCGIKDKYIGYKEHVKYSNTLPKRECIKPLVNESDKDYLVRINKITQKSISEANYGIKYGVSIKREPSTGAIVVQSNISNNTSNMISSRGKDGRALAEYRQSQRQRIKTFELTEPDKRYGCESVRFGEIVTGPPVLSVPPRIAGISKSTHRPGTKNLILKSMLQCESTLLAEKKS